MKRACSILALFLVFLLAACGTSAAPTSTVDYPLYVPSEWIESAAELPDEVFSPGIQTDLIANRYIAEGTVRDVVSATGTLILSFVLDTECGPVLFVDPSMLLPRDPSNEIYAEGDPTMYMLPPEGEHVTVLGIYSGYDWENDMPVLTYGGSHSVAVMLPTEYLDEPQTVSRLVPEEADPEETPEPAELVAYPANSTSKYLEEAVDPPEVIWSTTGEENGLIGSIYSFTGTVTDAGVIEVAEGPGVPYIVVETNAGAVVISNMYEGYRAMFEEEGLTEFFSLYISEDGADYSLPEIGETAEFICVYAGYSGRMEMPSLYLGANEYIVEDLRGADDEEGTEPTNDPEPEPEETADEPEPTPDPTPEPTPIPAPTHDYVLNTSTKKFHYPSCSSVGKMTDSNKKYFTGTREEVIDMGYEPCGNCHP